MRPLFSLMLLLVPSLCFAQTTGEGPNEHFDQLAPTAWFSMSLRDNVYPNTQYTYDLENDAMRVDLPDTTNELPPYAWRVSWPKPSWEIGSKVIVQHDFKLSKSLRTLITQPGSNGRRTDGFKFTNITIGGAIRYELRTGFLSDPANTTVDFRSYPGKLMGLTNRDEIASDFANSSYTGPMLSAGNKESHPGPDSVWLYRQVKPHPQMFKLRDDKWIRVTYEFVRALSGTELRIWLADSDTPPALVVSNPANPATGFLLNESRVPDGFYFELDTSQETIYPIAQPKRPCWFRNLLVITDASGESVLGGKPVQTPLTPTVP